MMRLVLSLLLLAIAAPLPAAAQTTFFSPKTSMDYTADDGIMTEEEMMAEAQDMYTLCTRNAYLKVYFNCECYAGAFLQQREKLGPMVMQDEIYDIVTNSAQTDASCANTEEMAGHIYQSCMSFAQNFSEIEVAKDNQEYCECAGNMAARNFAKAPRLSTPYINMLRANAMEQCRDPEVRRQQKAAADTPKPAAPGAIVPPKSAN